MQTVTGVAFWPLDPEMNEVRIEDIAHGEALMCRFGGHTKQFYSVAQHSIHVMGHLLFATGMDERTKTETRMLGLLHDAAEAYLGEVIRPLKLLPEFATYREAEAHLLNVILGALDVPSTMSRWLIVKDADNRMLATEARALMIWPPPLPWTRTPEPYQDVDLRTDLENPWTPETAERIFLERFRLLKSKLVKEGGKP